MFNSNVLAYNMRAVFAPFHIFFIYLCQMTGGVVRLFRLKNRFVAKIKI